MHDRRDIGLQAVTLAPLIFNLFLVEVTLAFRFRSGILAEDGVGLNYRLDGSLFNIRRLQAKSKISSEYVFELGYSMLTTLPCQVTQLMDYSVTSTVSRYL